MGDTQTGETLLTESQRMDLLRRFDAERRDLLPGHALRVQEGGVVRHVDRFGTSSDIVFSSHTEAQFDAAVQQEIAYFEHRGHDFEWKAYAHDPPGRLFERLRHLGSDIGTEEAVVVAPVGRVIEAEDPGHDVRSVTDESGLADYMQVRVQVWPDTPAAYGESLARQLRNDPSSLEMCVAYVDGLPVGSARNGFHPDSLFSGMAGGGVIRKYRHRGVYRSMVAHRARQAAARNVPWLQVDALPSSRPILEGLGFTAITTTRPCLWRTS